MRAAALRGFLALACMMAGCSLDSGGVSVRAVFTAAWGSPLDVKVVVEGPDGMALDGANVVLTDPASSSQMLAFDAATASYRASLFPAAGGSYRIVVDSRVGSSRTLVPVTLLSSRPSIDALYDSMGASALSGQPLDRDLAIACAWSAVPGATAYVVRVLCDSGAAWSCTSADAFVVIPAHSLGQGSYTISVEAQAIAGDPLLQNASYCSASNARGASLLFRIVE